MVVALDQRKEQTTLVPAHETSVSVIIPYSKPATVGNAIESVLRQDYPSHLVEIIVVGKGSSTLRERWPEIRAIDVGPIREPGRARNLGAAKASGEILLFLDDDCEAQEGWIRENLAELENPQVGAVSGMIEGKSKAFFARCVDFASFGLCQVHRRREGRLWSASLGIRKTVFEETGRFEESLKVHEDTDLCYRLNRKGWKTVYAPGIKVLHNHGRRSLWSFLVYQYRLGREPGQEVEGQYGDLSPRNWILARTKNPALYALCVIPFALGGTTLAVLTSIREHPEIVILAPFIFLGKIACHVGILRSRIENSSSRSWVKYGAIQTASKVLQYSLLRHWIKTPRVLTLFVTSRCNARCRHCFYWQRLNQNEDLAFEEMERLSQSLGKLDKLLISGGEPFLRDDLPEICGLFFANNRLDTVAIPTNGLQPELTLHQVHAILDKAHGRSVRVVISLDGPEAIHDQMRGVPGAFRKAVDTYHILHPLRRQHSNLSLGVASCATARNSDGLAELYGQLSNLLPEVDHPALTLLRGSAKDDELHLPDQEQLRRLYSLKWRMKCVTQPALWRLADWMTFSIAMETLRRGRQVIPCEAGRILAVVEDNGDVKPCELLPPIGNIRERDFNRVWSSPDALAARKAITRKECHCSHECNIFESLLAHPTYLLLRWPEFRQSIASMRKP